MPDTVTDFTARAFIHRPEHFDSYSGVETAQRIARLSLSAEIERPVVFTTHEGFMSEGERDRIPALAERFGEGDGTLVVAFFSSPQFDTLRPTSHSLRSANNSILDCYGYREQYAGEWREVAEQLAGEYANDQTGAFITIGDPTIIHDLYSPSWYVQAASFYAYENICFVPYDLVHSRLGDDEGAFTELIEMIATIYHDHAEGRAVPTWVNRAAIDLGFAPLTPELLAERERQRAEREAAAEAARIERERQHAEELRLAEERRRAERREVSLNNLRQFNESRRDRGASLAREDMERANENVNTRRQQFVDALRGFERAMHGYETAKSMAASASPINVDILMAMYDAETISDITISGDNILFNTRHIYIQDERTGAWHDIGTFSVKFNPSSLDVRFENLDRNVDGYDRNMHHPHIFGAGNACMGTLAESLVGLRSRDDWPTMIQMILMFLESANTSDPAGKYLHKWPLVRDPENVDLPPYPAGLLDNYRDPLNPDAEPEDDEIEDDPYPDDADEDEV